MPTAGQIITQKITDSLKRGIIPWESLNMYNHRNYISKHKYSGINILTLSNDIYTSCEWLTYNQLDKIGGKLKEGEGKKYHLIAYYNIYKKEDPATGKETTIPVLKYFRVYNTEQCDIPDIKMYNRELPEQTPIEVFNEYVKTSNTKVQYNIPNSYSPLIDTIGLSTNPENNDASTCRNLFHQAVHSTGHYNRLKRFSIADVVNYRELEFTAEELIAEIGSLYMCSYFGLQCEIDNRKRYINGWLNLIESNKEKFVISVASKAQKAVDFILNLKNTEVVIEEEYSESN